MFWRHVALISLMSCVACLTSRSCAGFDATLVPEDGQGSETCAEVGACDSCNACFGLSQLYYAYIRTYTYTVYILLLLHYIYIHIIYMIIYVYIYTYMPWSSYSEKMLMLC